MKQTKAILSGTIVDTAERVREKSGQERIINLIRALLLHLDSVSGDENFSIADIELKKRTVVG